MIYQVSFDTDEHFWKTGASHLPWICVREAEGGDSPLIATFNLQELPTYFLLNRTGELVARDKQISNLEKAIQQLL
jgi:predicted TIM-barrel fold metal-dependent hydrolase